MILNETKVQAFAANDVPAFAFKNGEPLSVAVFELWIVRRLAVPSMGRFVSDPVCVERVSYLLLSIPPQRGKDVFDLRA